MFSYNKATLYGDALVDYIWIRNKVDTQNEIDATLSYTYDPEWDANTFLLAPFNNTLNGGNVTSVGDKILYWQVYRKKKDDATLHFLVRISASQYALYDFNYLPKPQTIFQHHRNKMVTLLPTGGIGHL